MGHQTLPCMGMAQGDGQGVGGVDLRLFGQPQQVHDHQHHLLLVRPAVANHGLLDLARGVLGDLQTTLGAGHDGRAAGLTQLERRIGVACHEHLLDAHGDRPVLGDDVAHPAIDDLQPFRQRTVTGTDAARGHVFAAAPGVAHHAKAGQPGARIDTQDQGARSIWRQALVEGHQPSCAMTSSGISALE